MDVLNFGWKLNILLKREGVWGRESSPPPLIGGWRIFLRGLLSLLGGLGAVLGRLGSLLGCSWPFLVVLGAVLDRSSAVLGRLEAVLERSWAVLGHLGAVFERLGELKTLIFLVFFNVFCKINVLIKHGKLGWS